MSSPRISKAHTDISHNRVHSIPTWHLVCRRLQPKKNQFGQLCGLVMEAQHLRTQGIWETSSQVSQDSVGCTDWPRHTAWPSVPLVGLQDTSKPAPGNTIHPLTSSSLSQVWTIAPSSSSNPSLLLAVACGTCSTCWVLRVCVRTMPRSKMLCIGGCGTPTQPSTRLRFSPSVRHVLLPAECAPALGLLLLLPVHCRPSFTAPYRWSPAPSCHCQQQL